MSFLLNPFRFASAPLINFVAASGVAIATATSVNQTIPASSQANDLLIASVLHRSALTPPAGWVLAATIDCTNGTQQFTSVYTKIATSGDAGASTTWAQAAAVRIQVHIVALRGASAYLFAAGATAFQSNDTTNSGVGDMAVAAATANNQFAIATATSILAESPGNATISVSSGWTQTSTATAVDLRLGFAYRRRNLGETTGGQFTSNFSNPSANNGWAAVSLIFGLADTLGMGALNPADAHVSIELSNSNRTARKAGGGGWCSVRSVTSRSSGKWYWEWTPDAFPGSFIAAGFANASAPLSSYIGSDANGICIVSDGFVYQSGSGSATLGALSAGDKIGLAIDLDNDRFWCRRNAGAWNGSSAADPSTNAGGIALPSGLTSGGIFAGLSVQLEPTDQGTVNFGRSHFAYMPPRGFMPWG